MIRKVNGNGRELERDTGIGSSARSGWEIMVDVPCDEDTGGSVRSKPDSSRSSRR